MANEPRMTGIDKKIFDATRTLTSLLNDACNHWNYLCPYLEKLAGVADDALRGYQKDYPEQVAELIDYRRERGSHGDVAAMREALREAIGETCAGCKRDCDDCMNLKSGWMKKAKAALSAPARNCDRYKTAEDAHDAYDEITHADIEKYDECRQNCSICDEKLYIPCEVKWLFAPAAKEGEEHGKA